jgi:hypothetical protein
VGAIVHAEPGKLTDELACKHRGIDRLRRAEVD